MARVVQKNVRGALYLQVVEDFRDAGGIWRQKVLKSFGAWEPMAFLEAEGYAAQVNAFKARTPGVRPAEWDPWEKAAGAIIGGLALGWLLSQLGRK